MKDVKLEKDEFRCEVKAQSSQKAQVVTENQTAQCGRQGSEENRSSNALSNTGHSSSSVLEQGQSPVDDTGVSSASAICPAPICQQFWKAGNYEDRLSSKVAHQNGKNYLHVHPMFLHSNATSHKWAFGAIAELLDNAVDEIQNGATFVIVDKTTNPRDGSLALLIQDDGGGMDPEVMRQCMSFGFSGKKSKSAIGRYGNGFKTSTMRLGADVIVFSRHLNDRVFTQSIGLLSYTFLTQTRSDRIVVPMVDYEFNATTGNLEISSHYGKEHFMTNLAMLLQWSPYLTEAELLKQFDDIGPHGTKVIIYNLWFADESNVELDFDTDPEDIRICGGIKEVSTKAAWKELNAQHIANRLHYSLRVYLSILYLRLPNTFSIVLRGRPVEHHNLADDLKFQEFILYRPQSGRCIEGQVITTIGFLKEAPNVNVHGFNVYHKNRLILPFWPVVSYFNSRGKGVVGVLEANFIEPTHNKQDFERTSLFQKLEVRLKEMTWEYWDYHCGLIGYQVKKKIRAPETPQGLFLFSSYNRGSNPVTLNQGSSVVHGAKTAFSAGMKRKENANLLEPERLKRQLGQGTNALIAESNSETKWVSAAANQLKYDEATNLKQKNEKLHAQCLEYEKKTGELDQKAHRLRTELQEVQREYDRLMAEVASMDSIKEENVVNV